MSSFISLSTTSSSGFGIRSFTSTDHENCNRDGNGNGNGNGNSIKSFKREEKKGLSFFISLSNSENGPVNESENEDGNGIKRFEKEKKEFSNGKKWFLRLISPIIKQVDSDSDRKVEIPDDWSRGRFWRGV